MLTYEDCLAMAGLSSQEAEAIAAYEHLPATLAVELGSYLRRCPGGEHCIRIMILGEIEAARARRDMATIARLRRLLRSSTAAAPAGDGTTSAECHPKLLFPGRKPLDMRACAGCERLHPVPRPR
jgi:hypothetical protein